MTVNRLPNVSSSTEVYEVSTSEVQTPANDGAIPLVSDENDNPEVKEKQNKAKGTLLKDIENGNANYNQTGPLGILGGLIFDNNGGDYIRINGLPEDTKLGDIRQKYNLPPGSLRHLVTQGGGNFDTYPAPKSSDGKSYFFVYADNLAEGLGISKQELKEMFTDEHFSPWWKLK